MATCWQLNNVIHVFQGYRALVLGHRIPYTRTTHAYSIFEEIVPILTCSILTYAYMLQLWFSLRRTTLRSFALGFYVRPQQLSKLSDSPSRSLATGPMLDHYDY